MDLKESCGSQGSRESSGPHPTSWQAFAHTSTLHGLRFIFPYGQPSVRRLLWAAALLACLGLLVLESAERLAYFLSYPHVTSMDAVVSCSLVFPAVTICNLNDYRFGSLTPNDLYHAGELLGLLDVHLAIPQPHLAEPDVLAFLQERSNFTAYRPKAFSMKEFIDRVGHDLEEMMLYCRYQGQECSHSDFKPRIQIGINEMLRRVVDLDADRRSMRSHGGASGIPWRAAAVVIDAADQRHPDESLSEPFVTALHVV
ncbi:Acid-sensing ion channel 2 [Liparis tanakae]|uniref:Acid-sensing ion channel 2 n=1 Tax=Liparis tanakae TaxID=230148 RepID=A0A4Z2H7H7_9TELE|nr:Acid-sensing ion channel 2 [Liparis tanakae]